MLLYHIKFISHYSHFIILLFFILNLFFLFSIILLPLLINLIQFNKFLFIQLPIFNKKNKKITIFKHFLLKFYILLTSFF